jgi:formiminoglutamase
MPDSSNLIFDLTTRPLESLFFSRNNSVDLRIGDIVRHQPAEYMAADVVLLGCPQDEGVQRNGGRVGAALAPNAIRDRLYRLVAIDGLQLFDLGNTIVAGSLEEVHARHIQVVAQIMRDGKTLISLGGGNDIAYADCVGLAVGLSGVALRGLNIDTHFDVREDMPRNSGTPYRMLLAEGILKPSSFVELGHQPFAVADAHRAYLDTQGVQVVSLAEWRAAGIASILQAVLDNSEEQVIFWGLDIDVVRAADAPGVSAPNPTGLIAEEFCEVARIAGRDPRSRILEISEVNPAYDIDDRTSRLAAIAVWEFLRACEHVSM